MPPRESPHAVDVATEASLPRRLGAAIYEWLLLTALAFVTQFALLPLASPGRAGAASALSVPPVGVRTFLFCVQFAVFALYLCWFWTRGRRTLAQKTWGLRLTTAAGESLQGKAALLRYFALWAGPALALVAWMPLAAIGHGGYAALLLAFNFLWAFGDRRRLFLHDRIAGTRVIDSR
ncbi:MAG: RDD family protein [Casimicrobiaceae bacterium]